MDSDYNINTFRDFLQFYNLMSQTCFTHCVDNLSTRDLVDSEKTCVDRCTNKLIRFNHRTIAIYSNVQEKLVVKRIKEMEEQQQKLSLEENVMPSIIEEQQQQIPDEVNIMPSIDSNVET